MLPQPGKNGFADWYEFKSKIKSNPTNYSNPPLGPEKIKTQPEALEREGGDYRTKAFSVS